MKQKISITINGKVLRDVDSLVDNINIKNRSQAIEHILQNSLGERKVAVILAGGEETYLKVGKEYALTTKLNNSTLIEESIKKFRKEGFKEIYLIARDKILTRVFEILKEGQKYGVKINYIEEKSSNGTAESLRSLKGKINKSFLVVYADLFFNKINLSELWNSHIKEKGVATIMLTTHYNPKEKGVVRMEGNRILEFKQKPEKSFDYLVFSPIFAAEPEILEYSGKSLEENIFPNLAKIKLLKGHLSSSKEMHLHSVKDIKKIERFI